ncbi:hypothetical protein BGX34_010284 [Mortierella sp. NVP85]|nr:hypothetical protein BGX34_010284 [Mortierella sp. NVP85]
MYWTEEDKVKPLADVVEAVFGAVFLDSVAAWSRQPPYQAVATPVVVTSAIGTTSAVAATPTVVITPEVLAISTTSLRHRSRAAGLSKVSHSLGAKALKFFLGLHCYIADPVGRAGDLTKARDAILGSIKKRHTVQRSIGAELLTSGLVAAFGDFMSHYALPGITKIGMFRETYEKKADMDICLS